jgi:hypothetical protein
MVLALARSVTLAINPRTTINNAVSLISVQLSLDVSLRTPRIANAKSAVAVYLSILSLKTVLTPTS